MSRSMKGLVTALKNNFVNLRIINDNKLKEMKNVTLTSCIGNQNESDLLSGKSSQYASSLCHGVTVSEFCSLNEVGKESE